MSVGEHGGANDIIVDLREIEGQDEYGLYWFMLKSNDGISEHSSGDLMSS
jgi:hypothetical protein